MVGYLTHLKKILIKKDEFNIDIFIFIKGYYMY